MIHGFGICVKKLSTYTHLQAMRTYRYVRCPVGAHLTPLPSSENAVRYSRHRGGLFKRTQRPSSH